MTFFCLSFLLIIFLLIPFSFSLFFLFFFLMIRRPPRSTLSSSSAASDLYKRQYKLGSEVLNNIRSSDAQPNHPLSFHPNLNFIVFSSYLLLVLLKLPIVTPMYTMIAVSYTHLRAHETPEHLVCRLLLEKKKKHCLLYKSPK
eukprot:TRINITY_DN26478_c0_g1_i1.p1 TRINITY_DN26478_c0_g1~~TRINITY_DN26478_c0_g1_i1.p1  ORF type:complete len:143 (-),score=20.24 TRINITY_DN26478_c0_g1_i1:93-521(-)